MIRSGDRAYEWQWRLSWTACGPQSFKEPQVKKKAEVIDTMKPAASVDLVEETSAAFSELTGKIYPIYALHNGDSQKLEKLHKLENRELIQKSGAFLLVDPSYNVRCSCGNKNLKHNCFHADNLKARVRCVSLFGSLGTWPSVLHCTAGWECYKALSEVSEEEALVPDDREQSMKKR